MLNKQHLYLFYALGVYFHNGSSIVLLYLSQTVKLARNADNVCRQTFVGWY